MGSIVTEEPLAIAKIQADSGVFNKNDNGDPEAFKYNEIFFGVPALEGTRDEEGVVTSVSKMTWNHVDLPEGTLVLTAGVWSVEETPVESDIIPPEGAGVA